jgi:hypothetical protein
VCFWAPSNVIKYTTKQLLDIASSTRSGMEVAKADLVLGNRKENPGTSRAAPSDAAVQSSKKGTKGGRRRQK